MAYCKKILCISYRPEYSQQMYPMGLFYNMHRYILKCIVKYTVKCGLA